MSGPVSDLPLGHTIHRHASLASTNDEAAELARGGCPEGVVVVADAQTAGRGRHGHTWASPPGGLYASIVLRPSLAPASLQILGLAAAVAACEAVEELCGIRLDIKWPNDLLCNGKKVGGVIVEAVLQACKPQFAVVGLGLNANTPLDALPLDLRDYATSLAVEQGRPVAVDRLLREVLQHIDALYRPLDATEILRRWRRHATFLGERVGVSIGSGHRQPGEGPVTGIAEGVDSCGRLLLRMDDGSLRIFDAGDVHIAKG